MALDLNRIRAVCFDVDGTLRDTDDQLVMQLAALLRPLGPVLPAQSPQALARRFVMGIENPGTFLQGLSDRMGIDRQLARLGESLSQLRRGQSSAPRQVISGVPEMLLSLYDHFPMAVVSARSERSTWAFLEEHNLGRFFRVIVTGQTCRHTKPFPEPVQYAAAQMAVPAGNCLMVGDTRVDIRAGKLAGAQTVGVLCGFGEEAELVQEGADLILQTTSDLLEYLLQK